MNKKYISVALATVAGLATIVPAFAESNTTVTNRPSGMMRSNYQVQGEQTNYGRRMMVRPVVTGTVTSVTGNLITLSGHQGMATSTATQTIFTIDATNARIVKNNATGTVATVLAGDTLSVQGTLSGTTIVATVIRDGNMMIRGRGNVNDNNEGNRVQAQLQGNGQPVIAGIVSAINGTTLTITNKSNVVYTANISTAKVMTNNAVATTASVKIGDMVIIQGAVTGNSIVASTVIDNGVQKIANPSQQINQREEAPRGLFAGLSGFFSRLFGF